MTKTASYITGDGSKHRTLADALGHAAEVFATTGSIIAVEEATTSFQVKQRATDFAVVNTATGAIEATSTTCGRARATCNALTAAALKAAA